MLRTSWRLFLRTKRVFFPALLAGVGIAGFALYQGSLFRLHGDMLWFAGDLQQACGPLFLLELYLSYEFLASAASARHSHRPVRLQRQASQEMPYW